MGKSVLLAYAACVLCTDFLVKLDKVGGLSLHSFDAEKKGIPLFERRRVVLYSLKEKQKRIIEYYWQILIETFQGLDTKNELRIQRRYYQYQRNRKDDKNKEDGKYSIDNRG